ncbi:MAG: TolC family protein [Sphingobacteriia bacterium]|nr:MAG: TolC family protein [Sphingobacteriia bacterium]
MKSFLIYILSSFFTITAIAQNNVDNVVTQVERNNKSIQSNKIYWQAKQAEYKTGLTPYDPQVEYDYLLGSPVGAGNQKDFSITQRLDFPLVYKRKKELSSQQIEQANLQQQVYRQDILLEAKLLTLEIIYLNKKGAELNRRLINTQRLVQDYKKKMDKGDAIILDVNKAKLQLLNIGNETALNENEKQVLLTKISEFNGGIPLVINDTIYPIMASIPDFEILDSTIEANDPIIKVYEQEKEIMQRQIAVQKAMNLPKIETGYHSQSILGQSYKGLHAGITISLWENKNKLNAAKANLEYANSSSETHRLGHRTENKQYFEKLSIRFKTIQLYKEFLSTINNTILLNKSLALGQITILQYFYDESFYFIAYDKYLQAEWEYQQAVARLYKFQL